MTANLRRRDQLDAVHERRSGQPIVRYDKSMKTAKVAVSLPGALIAQIDRERRVTRTTRSAYFRIVLERHIRESSHAALTDAYIRGYTEHPESAEEVAAADAASVEVIGELTWQ